jgi:hypothetical protein
MEIFITILVTQRRDLHSWWLTVSTAPRSPATVPGVTSRQARALTLATASFGLGLAGHLEAGGHAGSGVGLAFGAGWCALSGWSYSRGRLSGGRVGGVLLANQVVLHLALAIGSASAMTPVMSTDCGHDGAMTMDAVAGTGSPAAAMQMLPSGWMLLAHLLSTLLAAGAILAVQAACLGLVALGRRFDRVTAVADRPPLLLRRPPRAPIAARPRCWAGRHPGARPGRGPPTLHLAW